MSAPAEQHRAGSGAAQADERLDQLGLAVALHAGDADDLAGAHLEQTWSTQRAAGRRRRR